MDDNPYKWTIEEIIKINNDFYKWREDGLKYISPWITYQLSSSISKLFSYVHYNFSQFPDSNAIDAVQQLILFGMQIGEFARINNLPLSSGSYEPNSDSKQTDIPDAFKDIFKTEE